MISNVVMVSGQWSVVSGVVDGADVFNSREGNGETERRTEVGREGERERGSEESEGVRGVRE